MGWQTTSRRQAGKQNPAFRPPSKPWYRPLALALVVALALHIAVSWGFRRFPSNFHQQMDLQGELGIRLLGGELVNLGEIPVDLALETSVVRRDGHKLLIRQTLQTHSDFAQQAEALARMVDWLQQVANIQAPAWAWISPLLTRETHSTEFWVDQRTGRYITPAEAQGEVWLPLPGQAPEQAIKLWLMPFAQSVSFEPVTSELGAAYEGKLLKTDIGSVQLPLVERTARLDLAVDATLVLSRATSLPLDAQVAFRLEGSAFGQSQPLLGVELTLSEATRDAWQRQARWVGFWYGLGRWWGPGLLLLIAAGWAVSLRTPSGRKNRRRF